MAGAFAAQAWHPLARLDLPQPPWNWLIVLAPASVVVVVGWWRPALPAIRFLGGASLAIVALLALATACWPIAVFPLGVQAPAWLARLGLAEPLRSLPFAVALLTLTLNLGCSLGRRGSGAEAQPWAQRLRFVVLHLGLLLAILGATAGHGGLVRARFILDLDAPPGAVAEAEDGRRIVLPFALRLERFRLDRFPPMLVVAEADGALHRGEALIGEGVQETLRGLRVEVVAWLAQAAAPAGTPVPFADPSANPAARVRVSDAGGQVLGEGWLHPASPLGPALFLGLPDGRSLHLEAPRPLRYLARVGVDRQSVDITVNHPLRRDGWAVYLLSYDEAMGSGSRRAVFEAVEDRALPTVYAGLILVLIGVLWHLWSPRRAGGSP